MVKDRYQITDAIGGYFSLELPLLREFHENALKLNTARNCLEFILRVKKFKKILIPFYTCDTILEPLHRLNIKYEFYNIDDNLQLKSLFDLQDDEALLYTNYYGLKDDYIKKLITFFGSRLIIDNSQAFYSLPINGICSFYSCRKFFGVPDGAYLYMDDYDDFTSVLYSSLEHDISFSRSLYLSKRIDFNAEAAFNNYHDNEEALNGRPLMRMSRFTERILQSIDYEQIKKIRQSNFNLLHAHLGKNNNLSLSLSDDSTPMVYPYLIDNKEMRDKLINNRIYIARYWPNVENWVETHSVEYNLCHNLLPLPIDQRYGEKEMEKILRIIES